LWIKVVVLAALTGWSALLAHKAIANFHDGLRPLFPEFLTGRLSRREMASTAFMLSLAFVIGFGLPFTLSSGLVLVYLLLLPADVIGVAATSAIAAFALAAAWGGAVVLVIEGIFMLAAAAPVNVLAALSGLFPSITYASVVFPSLAVGLQFGPRAGLGAVILTAAVFGTLALARPTASSMPGSAAMLASMALLLALAVGRSWRKKADGAQETEGAVFASNARRLRGNLPWLAVQGALLALACRLWIFAGSEIDFALLASGHVVQAAIADVLRGFAFMPLIITSALTTGVYQAVGFTLVFAVGFLSPHPLIAPLAGAAIVILEVLLLERISLLLGRFPDLRESAEHLRGALVRVLEVAMVIGSAIVADRLLPGGMGLLLLVGLYVLNETAGQRVFRLAAGPLAALAIGILLNLLVIARIPLRSP
jgi:hypothetical protein